MMKKSINKKESRFLPATGGGVFLDGKIERRALEVSRESSESLSEQRRTEEGRTRTGSTVLLLRRQRETEGAREGMLAALLGLAARNTLASEPLSRTNTNVD